MLILISIIGPGKIEITELPIGIWTQAYKDTVLDRLLYRFNKTPPLKTLFNKQLVKMSAVENRAGDGGPKKKEKLIESRHQRITHSEHILLRPGTYIGSVELVTELMWVYNKEKEMMIKKEITYFPRVYKIFDEILVNAVHNEQCQPNMDAIKIDVDATKIPFLFGITEKVSQ